jgi:hypothetical protein
VPRAAEPTQAWKAPERHEAQMWCSVHSQVCRWSKASFCFWRHQRFHDIGRVLARCREWSPSLCMQLTGLKQLHTVRGQCRPRQCSVALAQQPLCSFARRSLAACSLDMQAGPQVHEPKAVICAAVLLVYCRAPSSAGRSHSERRFLRTCTEQHAVVGIFKSVRHATLELHAISALYCGEALFGPACMDKVQ